MYNELRWLFIYRGSKNVFVLLNTINLKYKCVIHNESEADKLVKNSIIDTTKKVNGTIVLLHINVKDTFSLL